MKQTKNLICHLPIRSISKLTIPCRAFPISFRRMWAVLVTALALVACGEVAVEDGVDPEGPGVGRIETVTGPSFQEAKEAGEARLTFFYVPSSGFAYRGDDGRLTGVTAELLGDFARFVEERHGVKVEVDWVEEEEWFVFYRRVRHSEGGVFGIGNVTITEPRRDELTFSPPYLNNVAVLVTHAGVPELSAMDRIGEEFAGLTALPYPGTLHEERLEAIREEHFPDMTTRPVSSNDELVEHLASGEGFFGYIDVYNYWRALEAGRELRRHGVGDDASEQFGVILPRGSDWAPVMKSFFESGEGYIASDRFRFLLEDHLGAELAGLLAGDGSRDSEG